MIGGDKKGMENRGFSTSKSDHKIPIRRLIKKEIKRLAHSDVAKCISRQIHYKIRKAMDSRPPTAKWDRTKVGDQRLTG